MVPGGFDEQPAGVPIAGLRDRPLHPGLPGRELGGHQSEERTDTVPGEPLPVADLDRESESGQHAHSAQASQSMHNRGEFAVVRERLDRPIKTVPSGFDLEHGLIFRIERGLCCRTHQVPLCEPSIVLRRPCGTIVVDDPVPQQQLAQPVPGTHQITPAVFPSPHQIADGLLIGRGNGDRGDLVQPQQPGQMHGISRVGLHPIPERTLQLRGRCDRTGSPRPRAPETTRTPWDPPRMRPRPG